MIVKGENNFWGDRQPFIMVFWAIEVLWNKVAAVLLQDRMRDEYVILGLTVTFFSINLSDKIIEFHTCQRSGHFSKNAHNYV